MRGDVSLRQAQHARVFARPEAAEVPPLPCDLSCLSPLKDEMAANIDGTLTDHVFTDFIHHLGGGQFPLTAITAAGINQGFVLSQDTAALWCKFHVLSP